MGGRVFVALSVRQARSGVGSPARGAWHGASFGESYGNAAEISTSAMRAPANTAVAETLSPVNGIGLTDGIAQALSARFQLYRAPEALDPMALVLVALGAAVDPPLLD